MNRNLAKTIRLKIYIEIKKNHLCMNSHYTLIYISLINLPIISFPLNSQPNTISILQSCVHMLIFQLINRKNKSNWQCQSFPPLIWVLLCSCFLCFLFFQVSPLPSQVNSTLNGFFVSLLYKNLQIIQFKISNFFFFINKLSKYLTNNNLLTI